MNIVFFTHPEFLNSLSITRFTRMLADGMKQHGHKVEIWSPSPRFYKLPAPNAIKKWFGYIDQYLIFPFTIKHRIRKYRDKTLFVITDQALGIWVPLIVDQPHVIHCHDFLAQQSALGAIPENPVSWTGRKYQALIRSGFKKGKNFISVSKKTQSDLHQFLSTSPLFSEVVYNGLNHSFAPFNRVDARKILTNKTGIDLARGYLLHVGGNEWYKNRKGVIKIYNAWRATQNYELPLLLIGHLPTADLIKAYKQSNFQSGIHFISGLDNEHVRLAYAGASVFLFPSLAEGFGWPIAEAMASGCPVITTNEAPMTEVAGDAGFFIPRRPFDPIDTHEWALTAAKLITQIIELPESAYKEVQEKGFKNALRFETKVSIKKVEEIYQHIINCNS